MLDPKRFEELAARLGSVLAASPVGDMQKNAQALLSSFFSKLDLVSREEFDIQTQVLLRTREKLKALEARLDEFEKVSGKVSGTASEKNFATKAETASGK